MAKRFTNTDKYKSRFFRGLKGAYKLLWDYIQHDCDHAGVWIVDFEVAQIFIGADMPVNEVEALGVFGEMVVVVDGGSRWWVPSFVEEQYGILNADNRAHNSVLQRLVSIPDLQKNKGLIWSLQGRKDKDKDKDKDKGESEGEKVGEKVEEFSGGFLEFWEAYPVKVKKLGAWAVWKRKKLEGLRGRIVASVLEHVCSKQWQEGYVPHPQTYLNGGCWEDVVEKPEPVDRGVDRRGGGNGLSEL
jgi:hypothetical protein